MDFVERVTRTQFLGAEFLTWLWYQEEVGGGQFQLGGDLGDIELSFEDKLTMGSTALDEQQDSFKGRKGVGLKPAPGERLASLARFLAIEGGSVGPIGPSSS